MKSENILKTTVLIALTLILTTTAAANNATYQFEAFSGTIDSSGDLTQDSTNVQDYSAAIYDFETDSFETPESFYTEKHTSGENITLNFNISDNEKHHYGVYFYKRDSNGEDEYITYEYTVTVNESGNNVQGFDNTLYNTSLTFAKKTGATSNITLEHFDELAAGDPVHIGVNITAESPLDHTAYTEYIPNSSMGGPNLTEFYQTDVGYSLNVYNKTNSQNDRLENKEEIGTVTIDFGDYKRLDYTSIDETGSYNITGETDPTVDPKVLDENSETDFDFEQVKYLSKIETEGSPDEAFTDDNPFTAQVNLKNTFDDEDETDIAEKIEYAWLKDPADGAGGLDDVASSEKTNKSMDSFTLPLELDQSTEGDWYLCHRAYVNDTRSFVTKGVTSCNHHMIDYTNPTLDNEEGPVSSTTYSETGFTFSINATDNIQLETVTFNLDGLTEKTFGPFSNPTAEQDLVYNTHLSAGTYNYEWIASDRVGNSNSFGVTGLDVNPLAPNLNIRLENKTTGNTVNEIYWDDTVELNVTTDTSFAPLGFSSNFTDWSSPSDGAEQGSYSTDVSIDDVGTFNFEARAGHNNENYTEETVSSTLNVKEIPTNADITLLDQSDNEINSAGLMETVTIRIDPQADQKNSKAPVKAVSNLTLSAWDEINENGVYEKEIQMKEEGTFEFNMTAGETGTNNEGFTTSRDSETLTVSSSNGGDETLEWNMTIQDQEIQKSEAFSYGLEVNYTGTSSDLTWNVLNDNFTISTGSSKETVTVENSTVLDVREYEVPVEVYDSSGNYLTGEFNVTVNPDLYWNPEPNDQSIEEGNRYSQDLSGNVEYIGRESDLTWNITENRDLFTVTQGLVEDTQELSPGSYSIGLNVSEEDGRKINTSYTLTVNQVNTGGGGTTTVTSFSMPSAPAKELNISLSRSTAARGAQIDVSGTLSNAEGTENISITVNGEERTATQVENDGTYTATITAKTTGNKTVKASTETLEATATLEVVEQANFNSTTFPDIVDTGEQFTVCGQTDRTAEITLYEEGTEVGSKTGSEACFNRTITQSGTYDYRLTASADGKTAETTFTVDITQPSSSSDDDQFNTETEDSSPADSQEGFFGTNSMTGSFSQAMSGTTGKIGFSILGGLIITLLILLGL